MKDTKQNLEFRITKQLFKTFQNLPSTNRHGKKLQEKQLTKAIKQNPSIKNLQ